jgi:hypothetical protein
MKREVDIGDIGEVISTLRRPFRHGFLKNLEEAQIMRTLSTSQKSQGWQI